MNNREKFEAWAIENRNAYFPDFTRSTTNSEIYYGVATQAAWEAWQACEASREFVVELPNIQIDKGRFGVVLHYDDVVKAIEAAGGRVK